MSTKLLAVINLIISIIIISWNGYTGANGLNGNTVGGLSDIYDSLFTPAGYAFSIWGIIFIGLILISIQLLRLAFGKEDQDQDEIVQTVAPTLILANILNGIWLWAWLSKIPGISVMIMLGIFTALLITNIRNTSLYKTTTEFRVMLNCPLQVYLGWIIVASIANISAYLKFIGFDFLLSEAGWAISLILIATFVIIKAYRDKFWPGIALVGIWSFVAIAVKQWEMNSTISYTAIVCSIILLITIIGKKPTVIIPQKAS